MTLFQVGGREAPEYETIEEAGRVMGDRELSQPDCNHAIAITVRRKYIVISCFKETVPCVLCSYPANAATGLCFRCLR